MRKRKMKIKEVVVLKVAKNYVTKEEMVKNFNRVKRVLEKEAESLEGNRFVEFGIVVKPESPRYFKTSDKVWWEVVKFFGFKIPVIEFYGRLNEDVEVLDVIKFE